MNARLSSEVAHLEGPHKERYLARYMKSAPNFQLPASSQPAPSEVKPAPSSSSQPAPSQLPASSQLIILPNNNENDRNQAD